MIKQKNIAGMSRLLAVVILVLGGATGVKPAHAQGEKPAAIVNGEIISEQDFFDRLQRLHGQAFLTTNNQLRPESAGLLVLDALINERLTLQAANKAKVTVSEEEVNADVANLKKQPQVVAGLTGHLFTEEMLKTDIRIQGARFKLATMGVKVSPEEVDKYFKAHIQEYTVPEQWGLSVIRTGNPDITPKIDADLKAGKSFADTAKLYSDDTTTKDKGGDIGTITLTDTRIPAALRDAVRPLKLGEVSPTVRLEGDAGPGKPKPVTWWRILLRSKEPSTVRPFSELKSGLERLALIEKAGGYQAGDKKVADLRSQSEIKVSLPGYEVLEGRR